MPPLLSLCVPTYNRAALLDQSLRAILAQVTPDMAGQVEVVVIDNHSPDDTPAAVARAQADFPRVTLRSVRRPQNIGCDANFCDAPNQARGAWVYLLSDDDVLLPGAVARLLGLIADHPDVDAFALNVRQFWEHPEEEGEGAYTIEGDRLLGTGDEALVFLGTHIAFLSCIAFRREAVAGRDYTARYATNLAQAYMFLDALAPGRGLYAVRECFLAQRAGNNEGFDFFRVFVTNFNALIRHAGTLGYSAPCVRQVMARHLRLIGAYVRVFKDKGALGTVRPDYRDGITRLWRVYGPDPFLLLVVLPMILLPRPLFTLLFMRAHALYRLAKGVRPKPASAAGLNPPARGV